MSKTVANYVLHEVIGHGQYGKVYKGVNIKTSEIFAIKLVKVQKFKDVPKLEEFTLNEINTLAKLQHPNIVRFVEMLKTGNHFYFVYEYCNGGTLESVIHTRGTLTEEESLHILREIVSAFQVLVRERILHRDMKPSNILFHNGQIKIADFGFCKTLEKAEDLSQTMVGSPIYMAPEILFGCPYSQKAEVWSLGCVLYQMLFGVVPYDEKTLAELLQMLKDTDYKIPKNKNFISRKTEDFMKSMLIKNPDKRIDWEGVFQHELIRGKQVGSDSLTKSQRGGFPSYTMLNISNMAVNKKYSEKVVNNAMRSLMKERLKIEYLFRILQRILELNFKRRDPAVPFLLMRKIKHWGDFLKDKFVKNFDIEAFPHLWIRYYEKWECVLGSKEWTEFKKIVEDENTKINENYRLFQQEAKDLVPEEQADPEAQAPADGFSEENFSYNAKLFSNTLLDYCRQIVSHFETLFADKSEEFSKVWLLHVNEVLNCISIEEFFENFIDCNLPIQQQKYFEMVGNYSKDILISIIKNRIDICSRRIAS